MAKMLFKRIRKPKPTFFTYLAKVLIAFAMWLVLFSVLYSNLQLELVTVADTTLYLIGKAVLLALLVIAAGAYLAFFDYTIFARTKNILLIAILFLLATLFF